MGRGVESRSCQSSPIHPGLLRQKLPWAETLPVAAKPQRNVSGRSSMCSLPLSRCAAYRGQFSALVPHGAGGRGPAIVFSIQPLSSGLRNWETGTGWGFSASVEGGSPVRGRPGAPAPRRGLSAPDTHPRRAERALAGATRLSHSLSTRPQPVWCGNRDKNAFFLGGPDGQRDPWR